MGKDVDGRLRFGGRNLLGGSRKSPSMSTIFRPGRSILMINGTKPNNYWRTTTRELHVTPELDARFAALAAQRIQHSRWRYYVWLPTLRVADMWLRPRTEMLPCNTRWWEFDEQTKWLVLSMVVGILNLLVRRRRVARSGPRRLRTLTGIAAHVCSSAIGLPGYHGKSRAPLHHGMLSRGDRTGSGPVPEDD